MSAGVAGSHRLVVVVAEPNAGHVLARKADEPDILRSCAGAGLAGRISEIELCCRGGSIRHHFLQQLVSIPLQYAPNAITRAFALKFIPNSDYDVEGNALAVLGAVKKPDDFKRLDDLLFSKRLHECNLWHCVGAIAQIGGNRSVPVLKKFVEMHKKNRRWEYQQAVEWAEEELESLS